MRCRSMHRLDVLIDGTFRIAIRGLDPIIPGFLKDTGARSTLCWQRRSLKLDTYNLGTSWRIWCVSLYRSNALRRQSGLKSPATHASTGVISGSLSCSSRASFGEPAVELERHPASCSENIVCDSLQIGRSGPVWEGPPLATANASHHLN